MKKIDTIIVIFMITITFPSNGQNIKGRIIDANDGKPLAGAIVRTTADDGSTIQYSMSDSEGGFSIKADNGAKVMKVAFWDTRNRSLRLLSRIPMKST